MLNKKVLTAAVTTALLAGSGGTYVYADDFAIAGNIALTTDYRFRGISQTDESAAVQGGFDVGFEPGFYLGTWGSSVDFSDFDGDTGSYGSLELDYYGGWRGPIGDTDFGIDVGYLYYDYPGDTTDPKGDYQEVTLKGSWNGLVLGVNYSDDYYGETGEFFYYAADYSYSFLEEFALGLHVGYNDFENDKDVTFLTNDQDSYTDYSVSLTYTWATVGFTLAYVGTDLDDEDYYGTDFADDTAVFTIKKSL